MHSLAQLITAVDPQQFCYGRHFAGCLIKTHDGRLLLQKRGKNWDRFPDTLVTFGGQIDTGESFSEGMARELAEELGAKFRPVEGQYPPKLQGETEMPQAYPMCRQTDHPDIAQSLADASHRRPLANKLKHR